MSGNSRILRYASRRRASDGSGPQNAARHGNAAVISTRYIERSGSEVGAGSDGGAILGKDRKLARDPHAGNHARVRRRQRERTIPRKAEVGRTAVQGERDRNR